MIVGAVPSLLLWRNYDHALLMVARKTNGMAMILTPLLDHILMSLYDLNPGTD
jgi:hypothetical protein